MIKKSYAGFNPILVRVQRGSWQNVTLNVRVQSIDADISVNLELSRSTGEDGLATFDVSGTVVNGFVDKERTLTQGQLHGVVTNRLFTVFYRYSGNETQTARYAHNAVIQMGGVDVFDNITKFLMVKDIYNVYDGFPFGLTVYQPNIHPRGHCGDFSAQFNDDFWNSHIPFVGTKVQSGDMFGVTDDVVGVINATTDNLLYPNKAIATVANDSVTLLKSDSTEAPFYIRWISQIGGYEYKMFQLRARTEQRVKDIQTIQTNAFGGVMGTRTQQTISLSASNIVTVGDSELSHSEFEWLQGIALAPEISYYNKEQGKWYAITISEESILFWDTGSGLGMVEFNFLMPRVATQF